MTRSEDTLRSLALHDEQTVHAMVAAGGDPATDAHLDPRTAALAALSALVAIDAPVTAYQSAIGWSQAAGVTTEEIVGVLRTIAPIVGGPRVVAAASALSAAIGYDIEAALEAHHPEAPARP